MLSGSLLTKRIFKFISLKLNLIFAIELRALHSRALYYIIFDTKRCVRTNFKQEIQPFFISLIINQTNNNSVKTQII